MSPPKTERAGHWHARPLAFMESPAYRALSSAEHLALTRIELELRRHGGRDNGRLPVTKKQFVSFGIRADTVAAALRALEALGIIGVQHGRGGSSKHLRAPNLFFLNYDCKQIEADRPVTDDWKAITTLKEAGRIARAARKAKDQHKAEKTRQAHAAKGVRYITKNSFSPDPETGLAPDPKAGLKKARFRPESGSSSPRFPRPEDGSTLDKLSISALGLTQEGPDVEPAGPPAVAAGPPKTHDGQQPAGGPTDGPLKPPAEVIHIPQRPRRLNGHAQ